MRRFSHIELEEIKTVVAECYNWYDVCVKLDIGTRGSSQKCLKKNAIKFGIDFSHFKRKLFVIEKPHITEYFSNQRRISSWNLKNLLFSNKMKEQKCEICNLTEWNGELAPLELDHIDSNHMNNEFSNLQILCANCHSLETRRRAALKRKPKKSRAKDPSLWKRNLRPSSGKKRNRSGIKTGPKYKIVWPTTEELREMVLNLPLTQISSNLGVSDQAIKKRCKKLNIPTYPRGYWTKFKV